ncbi:MAG: hypothetical protein M1825_005743 [Sarcosagium campestre]|nr:MAG: hypothetical protein M1825_005743 [Sarcosagium campestre]
MKFDSGFIAAAMVLVGVLAQDLDSTPTSKPIAGNYTGALRPQIHFSPPQKFMNDPNGMFVGEDGVWHLYYQYNPTDIVAGNQAWGHATSRDLYHWENQPIAIAGEDSSHNIFSGSAVIDVNNTSGFFPNQTNGVVAIYTLNTKEEQTQEIAWSLDGGYTFTKYSDNPVISINSTQFRDPKVIWHAETEKWVMVIAYAQEFVIGIYSSSNLKEWTHESNFTKGGLLGLQYECPNLITIPMDGSDDIMWLLTISINPGAPLGGSITQYFPGAFNGTHFTAVDAAARIADFGKDNYAGQFFYGTPEGQDPISIAWASNWQYSQVVPTGELEGWRSAMSLPRVNRLSNVTRLGYDLISQPYKLSTLYDRPLAQEDSGENKTVLVDYSDQESGTVYFQMNVTGIPSANVTGTANFTFLSSASGESVSGGFFFGGDTPFWINRGYIRGFDNPFFTDKFSTNNLIKPSGEWSMEGVIDRSILEVFLDDGAFSATNTFFPEYKLDTMRIATAGLNEGVKVSVAVWGLKSAWAEQADDNGTVLGNSTSSNSTMNRRSMLLQHML